MCYTWRIGRERRSGRGPKGKEMVTAKGKLTYVKFNSSENNFGINNIAIYV